MLQSQCQSPLASVNYIPGILMHWSFAEHWPRLHISWKRSLSGLFLGLRFRVFSQGYFVTLCASAFRACQEHSGSSLNCIGMTSHVDKPPNNPPMDVPFSPFVSCQIHACRGTINLLQKLRRIETDQEHFNHGARTHTNRLEPIVNPLTQITSLWRGSPFINRAEMWTRTCPYMTAQAKNSCSSKWMDN